MGLSAGARLGPYEVVAPLGAGGMGEVWKARDTRLDREVALKLLPEEFFEDRDRVARFEREAKTLAALNHPGIAAIYAFEEIPRSPGSPGRHLLAMEIVEGEDLAQRLAAGPLPVEESLSFAKQIAEALEAAHEKGIVHRDLKPANVKVTPDGKVKLLDFGLAKIFENEPAAGSTSGASQSPTLTARATAAGVILGTAAYMSPEQARGKSVDKRADIWAFGCVLYEMLTGKRAFEGETVSDTLAAVLTKEPDWAALPEQTSAGVKRVLQRCLKRDATLRLRDIGDARLELSETSEEPERRVPATGRRNAAALPWVLAGLLLVALVGAVIARPRPGPPRGTVRFVLTPPPGGVFVSLGAPALTADGTTILYAVQGTSGTSVLWTRRLDSVETKPLPVERPFFQYPFWSPDGKSLAYGTGESLVRFDLATSRPQVLCEANLVQGSWGTRGDILFLGNFGEGIQRVSAEGGAPVRVTKVDGGRGETAHWNPKFLPDGRKFLFFASVKREGQSREGWICAGSLDNKEIKRIRQADAFVGVSESALVYTIDGILLFQPFDETSLVTRGDPVAIPGRVVHEGDTATADASVARDGTLAFRSDPPRLRQIVLVDRAGKKLRSIGAPAEFIEPLRLSPDGGRLAVGRLDERTALSKLWLVDLQSGASVRLTSGRAEECLPVFSPDGKNLAFSSDREGPYDIVIRSLKGGAPDRTLLATPFDKLLFGWTRDGEILYLAREMKETTLRMLSTEKDAIPRSLGPVSIDTDPALSPDGKWLAYTLTESGRSEVYVKRAVADGAKTRVSLEGGRYPRWRGDGKEIFFVGKDETLMAVPWEPDAPERRLPAPLFPVAQTRKYWAPYDVVNDGQTFLLLQPVESTTRTEITVVVNGVPAS